MELKIQNAEKTVIKITNIFKMLTICAVISVLFIVNMTEVFANKSKRNYFVTVEYLDCYDINGNPTGEQSRTETWRKGSIGGDPVYQEHRNCEGETTTSGKKPLVGGGGEVWETSKSTATELDITIANAFAMKYFPIDSSESKNDKWYQFEFPIDWIYNNVANTSILQNSNFITVTTDNSVQVQLVNLSTGYELTEFYNVGAGNGYTFNISDLPVGCIYSIIVKQYIPEAEEEIIIHNHNFCK